MGSVLSTAAAYAGEDLVRFLPFIAVVFLAVWVLLILGYGGCGPFWRQLIGELRELLPVRAETPGQAPLLGRPILGGDPRHQRGPGGAGSHGYDGRWSYVTPPRQFAPPIQETYVRALNERLRTMQQAGQPAGIPDEFLCPITREVMRDPVMAADGRTYEYEAIQRNFDTGNMNSPLTGARLAHRQLMQNQSLRSLIVTAGEDALRRQPQAAEPQIT